jgi:hypothetical protein
MTIFRLVGGTDVKPTGAIANRSAPKTAPRSIGLASNTTSTAENGRLREQRKQAWREAEAATRYWRLRLDFEDAVSFAQRLELPEGSYHPAVESKDRYAMVGEWRKALVKQILTPAPDTRSVTWKQTVLAGRSLKHTDVTPERLKHVIANDLAFLAAHPIRYNNSEAAARRREFKEAMRRRIRDVAASRDLSDEEIQPALTLKHEEIAGFSEQYGVNIEWLLGGEGRVYRGGHCELVDSLDGGGAA